MPRTRGNNPTDQHKLHGREGRDGPSLHFQGPPPHCTFWAICWVQSQRGGAVRGQLCISPHVFCHPSIHRTFTYIQSSVAALLSVAGGYLKQEVRVWFQVVPLCAAEAVWNHCKCVKSPSAHTNSGPFSPTVWASKNTDKRQLMKHSFLHYRLACP